jgi:hypothetical protein
VLPTCTCGLAPAATPAIVGEHGGRVELGQDLVSASHPRFLSLSQVRHGGMA